MSTATATLTPEQTRILVHVSRSKGHSHADIAAAVPAVAENLAALPETVLDRRLAELAGTVRSNKYAGRCRDCGQTVEADTGGLVKAGGSWVTYHVDPCPAPVAPAEVASAVEGPARTNGYSGKCVDCGVKVPAGEGELFKNGDWKVRHFPKGSCPEVPAPVDESATSDGYEPAKGDVHVIDGEYFRVHVSQSSGKFYGAIWNGAKFLGAARDKRASGSLAKMSTATLVTAEQAAEFGHMAKQCCFCSTAIDTPESTAVGYGPHCAEKRGLPWGC